VTCPASAPAWSVPTPWTPKPAFLLADALPEAEPLPARLVPASAADVAPFTAPVTVPARPTLPLAEPFLALTEWLAEPFAEPEPTALTLLAIDAGPPSAPPTVPPTLPTVPTVLPSEPTPFSELPSVPLTTPPTVPPTLPSNCACAGAAPNASAEAATSRNLVMSFSFELHWSFAWLLH
jgi:hypothetical protein